MSFSCEIKGKNGVDLLKKYGVQDQLLGIAQHGGEEPEEHENEHYPLSTIRDVFCDYYRLCRDSMSREQSRDLIREVKKIISYNLEQLKPTHCECCKCPVIVPKTWKVESAKKFLSIPLDEVYKAYGSY